MMKIVCIDIGRKNFAHYVEICSQEDLDELRRIYKSTDKSTILDALYLTGTCLDMGVSDIGNKDTDSIDIQTRKNLFDHLNSISNVIEDADVIIVEQQYFNVFRRARSEGNLSAIKLAECTLSWFMINYPSKSVQFFGAQYKTQLLGAPKKMTKYQRKKWSVEKCIDLLHLRRDIDNVTKILKSKKKDDMSDACVMCQAYKLKTYVMI